MKSLGIYLLTAILFCSTCIYSPAQTLPGKQNADEKLVVGSSEVVLDAVVRDKKGRPVTDLSEADFQILEDGIPQSVSSFRVIRSAEVPKTNGQVDRSHAIEDLNTGRAGVVAMVFDRLSAESRKRAHDAAMNYVGNAIAPNDFVGVYGIDLNLRTFQTFTNSGNLLRKAIEQFGTTGTASFNNNTDSATEMSGVRSDLGSERGQSQAVAEATGRNPTSTMDVSLDSGTATNSPSMQELLHAMELRIEDGYQQMEEAQQGRATANSLLAIISAMSHLPGRKSILFFSDGVLIPTSVAPSFRSIIGNANRANVSIYSVDAAGLRTVSGDIQAGQEMTALGQQRVENSEGNFHSLMKDSERNEDLLRRNPDSGLGQLSDQTGGLLVSGTNNLADRLRRLSEDMHSYYVLSYKSTNQNFDGAFRQISIKLKGSGNEVQTRKGYFALKSSYDSPVMPFEVRALAVLDAKKQPNSFPTKAGAFSFPQSDKPGLVPVFVEIPAGTVNFTSDPVKKTYATDFTVVVLLRDSTGHATKKLSSQYLLTGALDQLDAAKKRSVMFYQEAMLDPGDYTVEAIVYDATNNQSSVNTTNVTVPSLDSQKLRLSSIVVIERTHKMTQDEQKATNPFHIGDMLVFPNLGEPLHKAGSKGLSLFLNIYPGKGSSATPKLKLEFDQNGQSLGQLPVDLPPADKSGNFQYTATIPLDMFPPGEYDLKVIATDGSTNASRTVHFNVQP